MGDEITVMVIEVDPQGRINLSRRAALSGEMPSAEEIEAERGPRRGGFGGPPRGGGFGGDRGGPSSGGFGRGPRPGGGPGYGGDRGGPRGGGFGGDRGGPRERDRGGYPPRPNRGG